MSEYKLGKLKKDLIDSKVVSSNYAIHFDKYFVKSKLHLNINTYDEFLREHLDDLKKESIGLPKGTLLDLQMLLASKHLNSRSGDRYIRMVNDYKKAYAIASNYEEKVYKPIEAVLNHIMCTLPSLRIEYSPVTPWGTAELELDRTTMYHTILDIRDHTYMVDRPYTYSISSAIRYSNDYVKLVLPKGAHRNIFLNRIWRKSNKDTKLKIEKNNLLEDLPPEIKRPVNFDKKLWREWLEVYDGD